MLRGNIRLRREYIYRKSLEGKERLLYEKKIKIKKALEEGKPIPTELRNEEAAFRQEIDLEDDNTAEMQRNNPRVKHGNPKSIDLKEIGPRFELRLYQINLGTVDQNEAQTEWVSRPYMNTSIKRKFIGD